jgi:4-amino-4-deoxy-L-arabinose transferase-like glycosyltransferase
MIAWIRKHAITLTVLLLLALGAYLRLYRISEYMTFLGDEGRDMMVMKRMIIDHKFTLLGPTASVGGFFLGPIYYYFMLPFVWISGMNPAGAAVMVALFGIATIYLVYRVGKDFFDEWVGLAAASLYALSPVVIAYSRSSWNPNLVPFFSTLLIYLLWRVVVKAEKKWLFWIGVTLGIGLQLHYLFLFLFPVVGIWFLLFGREKSMLRPYLLGIVGFFVGYGPFLAFELRHGFPNTISIFRFLQAGEDTGFTLYKFINIINDVVFRLVGRLVLRLPQPEVWVNIAQSTQVIWEVSIKFILFATVALLIIYILRLAQFPFVKIEKNTTRKTFLTAVLLALWFAVPLGLFGLYKKGIYDYYFGLFFVLPFLFTALILRVLATRKIGALVATCAFAYLVYFNWQGRPFIIPPNNQLGQARAIATAAMEKTGGKPFNFALLANANSDHVYRYFFEIWGNAPITIERADLDPERKTVTDQLIVICELPECKPLGHPLWEIAGFGQAQIEGEWPVSFVTIQRLVHYQGK